MCDPPSSGGYSLNRNSTVKGQILIIILLLILGIWLLFGLVSRFSIRLRATPIVQEAYWAVGDQDVSISKLGEDVEATIKIEATEHYVGSIVVKVKKDIRFWLDSDYHITTIPLDLGGGEERMMKIGFSPDEVTRGSLRGYFVEIEFQSTRTTWTMENSYPPRLKIVGNDVDNTRV